MKKFLALLLALTCAVSLTSCGIGTMVDKKKIEQKRLNFKDAVWDGYSDVSFIEFIEEGLIASATIEGEEIEVDASYEEGWDEAEDLDEDDVSKDATPVTYIFETTGESDSLSGKLYIFMEFEDDELEVAGGKAVVGDMSLTSTKNEMEDELDRLIDKIESAPLYSAVWKEYKDMSFAKFLDVGLNASAEASGIEIEIKSITVEEGWGHSKSKTDDEATAGTTPVTYIVDLTNKNSGEDGLDYFFMEYKDGELEVVGANFYWGEEVSDVSKTDAELELNHMVTALDD